MAADSLLIPETDISLLKTYLNLMKTCAFNWNRIVNQVKNDFSTIGHSTNYLRDPDVSLLTHLKQNWEMTSFYKENKYSMFRW